MPQSNVRNRNRKNRNRRRAQQLAAVAESSRNGERQKHEKEASTIAACFKNDRSNDDDDDDDDNDSPKTNDSVPEKIDPIQARDDESRHRGFKFRPDDKRSIEKIELISRPRTVEITTFSSLPLEATIGHIAGVGILETGIRDKMTQEPVVTVSEPAESPGPFPDRSRIKHRSSEMDGKGDPWAKGDRLEIREVSDSDAEADCDSTNIEFESDIERNSPAGSDSAISMEGVEPRNRISQQIVPRSRISDSDTESLTLRWDTVLPKMMERKFPRKRNTLESIQLPSFFEERLEEKGSCEIFTEKIAAERDESVEKVAVLLRRKMRKRAISELYYPSLLNIIQEESDRLSEDESQHIRDFINEEISKYRRKNKHSSSSERTIEGEGAEEDVTRGNVATICEKRESDVSTNIDTMENDIYVELHPSDASNNSGELAATVDISCAEDTKAEVIESAEPVIRATDSVSSNESVEIALNGMQNDSDGIEHHGDEGRPKNIDNDVRIDDILVLNDASDTNEAQHNKLLHKIRTTEESDICKDHKIHSSFNLYALQTSTKQFLSPPLPPKRSSSFGHGFQRLPTPIEIEGQISRSNVYRPLSINNEYGPTNLFMCADGKTGAEKLESSRLPELCKRENLSAPSGIDRTVYEADSTSNSCEFSSSSNIIRTDELDDYINEDEPVGTASKTEYVERALAEVDPSATLSAICDDDPHGVETLDVALASATGTEITYCEEERPVAPVVPSASPNRQRNETEARTYPSDRNDFKSFKTASDKSYTRANCSTKDGPGMHRCLSDSNDAEKLGRMKEESMLSFHREQTMKSETSETRMIERREESSSSIDQRTNYYDSNYSLRDSKREERRDNPLDSSGCQTDDIPVCVNFSTAEAEVSDFQGCDSSSSTASLSTVKHRPLETSLADISAIREAKDDSFNDEPDQSLKRKFTSLKNEESTDSAVSEECSESPQPIPYSPVEDLYYVSLDTDVAVEETSKTRTLYQQRSPASLRELCVEKILSMPFGSQIISEITTSKFNIFEGLRNLQRFVSNVPSAHRDNARLKPHGVNERRPNDTAGLTKASSSHQSLRPNDFENAVSDYVKMPEGVNIETRLSNVESERGSDWKCLSTSKDPKLLVCLSPSQQTTSVRTSADALLDLHQKFLKRYSYREEQPHCTPLLRYRVQVCPTTNAKENDDANTRTSKSSARSGSGFGFVCNAAGISSNNRLLEIIKKNSPSNLDFRNVTLTDRQSKMVDDSWNSSYTFERDEHPTRPDDWSNRANRRDRSSAAVNELFLAAAKSEDGRDDKPGHRAIPEYRSKIAPSRSIVEVKHGRSSDNTMIRDSERLDMSNNVAAIDRSSCDVASAAKRVAPWRTTGKRVNPALIDDKLEVPPLPKRAVKVDKSCIDVTSIFDQNPPRSPLVLSKDRQTTEELIKHMAAAEIMGQLKKLQTETSQRLDGNATSSLPQECFVQQLRYIEVLEDQLKNVILAEEEERKAFDELQMHVRWAKQYDDAKTLSPVSHVDTRWETNVTPECECETRIDDRNITNGKCVGNKRDEQQGNVDEDHRLGRAHRIDPEIPIESWQGKSLNSGNNRRQDTGIIDRTRKLPNEISLEKGEKKLPENIENRAGSKKGNVGVLENGTLKLRESKNAFDNEITKIPESGSGMSTEKTTRGNRVYNSVELKKSTILPTNGEVFRQQMYDEYMRKMLERQERKNHKVVKISSHESTLCKMNGKSDDMSIIAKEFIEKARSRLSKSEIDLDESETTDHEEKEYRDDSDGTINAKCLIDGQELEDVRKLPKHLREFLKISTIINDEGGVWSPGQTLLAKEPSPERIKEPRKSETIPPVWIPANAGVSPIAEKKEFRPVSFESPVLSRKKEQPKEEETALSWENERERKESFEESRNIYQSSSSRIVNSHSAPSQGLNTLAFTPRLPRAQNPTITLLQKAREGQLPKGAAYLEKSEFADNYSPIDEKPLISPGEIIYTVKKEYESEPETENEPPKKMADLGARKFEGIGPVTKEGIPLVLRSEVKESNQAKWYKRMYHSLHRGDKNDDYVTVRYKQKRGGRYGYGSSSGYLSEPEPRAYSDRSVTIDSRRRLRNKENDFTAATMPRRNGALKYSTEIYKNQPGRIEDYEPGHSSIAEKETKEPFDQRNARIVKPYMLSHGLKESGYESDSTLVFRRREDVSPLSLLEQRLAYKTVQSGGDVPLHGLRKPAPERPKEYSNAPPPPPKSQHCGNDRQESPRRYVEGEVTIHYRSPVRTETKELLSEEELARRSAENMRRVYQEERRRKYLQELHDIDSRRHTDNFTPSQKSPIPLNRYDDFVDDLSKKNRSQDQTPEPRLVARALYNFVGQSSRELTFRRGDIIFVRRQVDKNWYEGEYNAMIGLFPFNYVEILPYDGMRTTPKKPHEGQARAKFNFVAQTNLELSLAKGELVVLTRRVDENWYEGRVGNRTGIFPASYVEVITEPGHRSETSIQSKPVASPAAHSLLANSSSGGKMSMGPHHYVPSIPVNIINTIQPSYNSLPRMGGSKLHVSQLSETLHIDTHSEPIPYRALYNYKPQNDDELELKEGDTVYVMEKCDDGWYVGSSQRTGYFGTFPGNYVDRL